MVYCNFFKYIVLLISPYNASKKLKCCVCEFFLICFTPSYPPSHPRSHCTYLPPCLPACLPTYQRTAIMVYKSLNGLTPDYIGAKFIDLGSITHYSLRDTESKLAIPLPRTNFIKNSFIYSGAVLWNSLPCLNKGYVPPPISLRKREGWMGTE